jgi:predicted ATPase
VHGLYWVVVNLATRRSVLLAVDDAHWGDDASLRWLAYLAARLDGIEASLVVPLRPHEPRSQGRPLQAVRAAANATVRPSLLSEQAVAAIAQKMLGIAVEGDACASIHRATGGNPFSNRQIAQDLYLSIKTVEGHLARAYSKLDITTRSELDRVFESEKARVPTL